jgi:hypothetical protein
VCLAVLGREGLREPGEHGEHLRLHGGHVLEAERLDGDGVEGLFCDFSAEL